MHATLPTSCCWRARCGGATSATQAKQGKRARECRRGPVPAQPLPGPAPSSTAPATLVLRRDRAYGCKRGGAVVGAVTYAIHYVHLPQRQSGLHRTRGRPALGGCRAVRACLAVGTIAGRWCPVARPPHRVGARQRRLSEPYMFQFRGSTPLKPRSAAGYANPGSPLGHSNGSLWLCTPLMLHACPGCPPAAILHPPPSSPPRRLDPRPALTRMHARARAHTHARTYAHTHTRTHAQTHQRRCLVHSTLRARQSTPLCTLMHTNTCKVKRTCIGAGY